MVDIMNEVSVCDFQSFQTADQTWMQLVRSPVESDDSGLGRSPNPSDGNLKVDVGNPTLRHQGDNKSEKLTEVGSSPYNQDSCSFSISQSSAVPNTNAIETQQLQCPYFIFDEDLTSIAKEEKIKTSQNHLEVKERTFLQKDAFMRFRPELNNLIPKIRSGNPKHSSKQLMKKQSGNPGHQRGCPYPSKKGPLTVRQKLEIVRENRRLKDLQFCHSFAKCTFLRSPVSNQISQSVDFNHTSVKDSPARHQEACPSLVSSNASKTYHCASESPCFVDSWTGVTLGQDTNFSTSSASYSHHGTISTNQTGSLRNCISINSDVTPNCELPQIIHFSRSQIPDEVNPHGPYFQYEAHHEPTSAVESISCVFEDTATSFQTTPQLYPDNSNFSDFFDSVRNGDVQKLSTYLTSQPQLLNAENDRGMIPLFLAIENCRFDAVKLLVQHQANLNFISRDGNTALWYAAQCPAEDIMIYLLNCLHPADAVSLICKSSFLSGSTPLIEAARCKQRSNLLILLQHGANWLDQNREGFSALHFAVQNCDLHNVETLIQFVRNPVFSPEIACFLRRSNYIFSFCLRDMTSQATYHHWTPLHFASALLHNASPDQVVVLHNIIHLLLSNKADPYLYNAEGKTPEQLLPPPGTSEISQIHQLFANAPAASNTLLCLQGSH